MNPPFERGQDMEHVTHAINLLAKRGKLVALMSPSAFTGSTKKHKAFKELFDSYTDWRIEKIINAFKGVTAFRTTSITVEFLVVEK